MEKGNTIWLMGLSGSGKTTLSKMLVDELIKNGRKVQLIDGDVVREEMNGLFGYSREDRIKAARVYRLIAKLLNDNGIDVVVAAIAPFEKIRKRNREYLENYIEISLNCSIDKCIERDVKGLYRKALNGKEFNVVGIDLEYEQPVNSDIYIDTENLTLLESFNAILNDLNIFIWS